MGAVIAAVAVGAWLALVWALWIRPLLDAGRRPRLAYWTVGRSKVTTIWLILLAGWVGGLYYLVRIKPDLAAAEAELVGAP